MTGNMLDIQPAPYLRYLPNDTLVSYGGSQYRIWGGSFAYHSANGNTTGPLIEENIDLRFQDPFAQEAIARLPTGLRYVRRGNIWLLLPIPAMTPVILIEQVPGHEEYWVVEQIPYTGGGPVVNPLVIPLNVPISSAIAGHFVGANEPAFTPLVKGKISVSVDVMIAAPGNASLKSSSQVHAQASKGRLAKVVAREVERALTAQNHVLVAFFNQMFVQDLSFEDVFLVDLVQMSRSTYQPTIALRVRT